MEALKLFIPQPLREQQQYCTGKMFMKCYSATRTNQSVSLQRSHPLHENKIIHWKNENNEKTMKSALKGNYLGLTAHFPISPTDNEKCNISPLSMDASSLSAMVDSNGIVFLLIHDLPYKISFGHFLWQLKLDLLCPLL